MGSPNCNSTKRCILFVVVSKPCHHWKPWSWEEFQGKINWCVNTMCQCLSCDMHCVVLAVTAMYYAHLPVSCEVISIECKSIVCHCCDTPGKVTDEQSFSKFGVAKYCEHLLQSSNGTFVPWGMLSICVCSWVGRVSCDSCSSSWLLKLEINLLYCSNLHGLNFCTVGVHFLARGVFRSSGIWCCQEVLLVLFEPWIWRHHIPSKC
jgi:hypothetical protein